MSILKKYFFKLFSRALVAIPPHGLQKSAMAADFN